MDLLSLPLSLSPPILCLLLLPEATPSQLVGAREQKPSHCGSHHCRHAQSCHPSPHTSRETTSVKAQDEGGQNVAGRCLEVGEEKQKWRNKWAPKASYTPRGAGY